MWAFTKDGFVSVVRKDKKKGGLQARSRDLESIERFCDVARISRNAIITGGGTDYQFRVLNLTKRQARRWAVAVIDGIDYENFKNEVKRSRGGKFASALGRVWGVMWDVAPPGSRYKGYGTTRYTTPYFVGSRAVQPTLPAGRDDSEREWWNEFDRSRFDTPEQAEVEYPSVNELMDMSDADRDDALDELWALDTTEADDIIDAVDRLLAQRGKSVHDMTEDEWRAYVESESGR